MKADTAIIIPVHNRRAITLRCLRVLADDGVFAWARVLVVDDGSTDGTAGAVAREFPQAEIVSGDGHLWWTGAIRLGMETAIASGAEFLIWLNDDCVPAPGALRRLREGAAASQGLVGGVCLLPGTQEAIYGGLRSLGLRFDLLPRRPGTVEPCDALTGNLVCMPAKLVQRIGLPDANRLPHAFGDIDFGLRAGAAGLPVLLDHDATAEATPNAWSNYASWLLSDIAITEIWRIAWSKRSYGYFPAQWVFFSRHFGWRGALYAVWSLAKRVPITAARLLVPRRVLRAAWGTRSAAWREERRLRSVLESRRPQVTKSPNGRETSPHSPPAH